MIVVLIVFAIDAVVVFVEIEMERNIGEKNYNPLMRVCVS
jgi:hypothetical protein